MTSGCTSIRDGERYGPLSHPTSDGGVWSTPPGELVSLRLIMSSAHNLSASQVDVVWTPLNRFCARGWGFSCSRSPLWASRLECVRSRFHAGVAHNFGISQQPGWIAKCRSRWTSLASIPPKQGCAEPSRSGLFSVHTTSTNDTKTIVCLRNHIQRWQKAMSPHRHPFLERGGQRHSATRHEATVGA